MQIETEAFKNRIVPVEPSLGCPINSDPVGSNQSAQLSTVLDWVAV